MNELSSAQAIIYHLITIFIKSVGGGIGFAILGLEIKKNWEKERKWRLAILFGICIFGFLVLFTGV